MKTVEDFLKLAKNEGPWPLCLALLSVQGGRILSLSEEFDRLFDRTCAPWIPVVQGSLLDARALTAQDLVVTDHRELGEFLKVARHSAAQVAIFEGKTEILQEAEAVLVDWFFSKEEIAETSRVATLMKSGRQHVGESLWRGQKRPALFLDRDGVVNEEVNYLRDPALVKLLPGVAELIQRANQKQWVVVIVTNQSGLGKDYFSFSQYDAVTTEILTQIAKTGAWVDQVQCAPHYLASENAWAWTDRNRRKPRPAMIHSCVEGLRIDLSRSILIGDRARDVMLGYLAGVGQSYMLQTDLSTNEWAEWTAWKKWLSDHSKSLDGDQTVKVGLLKAFSDVKL